MCLVIGPNIDVRNMISRSVLPATRARYESANLDWLAFRTNNNGTIHLDPYNLQGSNLSMILLVLEYMVYLEKDKHYNGNLISRLLTGLGYHCKLHVVHANVMTHPSISAARQAIAPIVLQRNGADKIMGLNLEMLQWLRTTFWLNGSMDQRMIYMAVATGYNFTLRPGHVAYMGLSAEDHRYRFGDVSVESENGGTLYSLEEWWNSGIDRETRIPVGLLILRIDSSKSHGSRHGGDGRLHFISLGNEFEDQYFSDFLEWLELCGLSLIAINRAKNKKMKSEGDLPMLQRPLFSRIHPTTFLYKRNIAKDLTESIKASAVAFDFNPKSFTARSLRIGGCTTAAGAGASAEAIQSATGHKNFDTTLIYTRPTNLHVNSLGYGSSVSVQDIRRMTANNHG